MGEKGLAEAVGSTAAPSVAHQAASMAAHGAAELGSDVATAIKTTAVVAVAQEVVGDIRGRIRRDGEAEEATTAAVDPTGLTGDVGTPEATPPKPADGEPKA